MRTALASVIHFANFIDISNILASSGAMMNFCINEVCFRPTPLILDEQGRTIDAKTGQAIQLALHTPTLKVPYHIDVRSTHLRVKYRYDRSTVRREWPSFTRR